jgi:hypothetical protein
VSFVVDQASQEVKECSALIIAMDGSKKELLLSYLTVIPEGHALHLL